MKKTRALLLLGLVVLSTAAAGCGSSSSASSDKQATQQSSKQAARSSAQAKAKREAASSKVASQSASASSAAASRSASASSASAATASSTSQKSAAASSVSAQKAAVTAKMDLTAIQGGDFSSLMGTWVNVANAANYYDGKGITWKVANTGHLTVTKTTLKTGEIALQGTDLTQQDGQVGTATYSTRNGVLWANGETGAIVWDIGFYPAGAKLAALVDNAQVLATFDLTKPHLLFRSSNNQYSEVFQAR